MSEGFEAAQGEGIKFARRLGHRYQGDNKAKGALEGLQSEWGEIPDLVSFVKNITFFFVIHCWNYVFYFRVRFTKRNTSLLFHSSLELILFRFIAYSNYYFKI